jgi:hypothetical protein
MEESLEWVGVREIRMVALSFSSVVEAKSQGELLFMEGYGDAFPLSPYNADIGIQESHQTCSIEMAHSALMLAQAARQRPTSPSPCSGCDFKCFHEASRTILRCF